jgi:hypothetical protein
MRSAARASWRADVNRAALERAHQDLVDARGAQGRFGAQLGNQRRLGVVGQWIRDRARAFAK